MADTWLGPSAGCHGAATGQSADVGRQPADGRCRLRTPFPVAAVGGVLVGYTVTFEKVAEGGALDT